MSSIYRSSTIGALIGDGRDGAPAIGAPERIPLTHQGLRDLAERTSHGAQRTRDLDDRAAQSVPGQYGLRQAEPVREGVEYVDAVGTERGEGA